jgi:hypothetical protein
MKSLRIIKGCKLQVGVRGTPACREGEMEGSDLYINAGKSTRHISPGMTAINKESFVR